jgi:VWFA-related protein
MRSKRHFYSLLISIFVVWIFADLTAAQTAVKEKPELKDIGASLKRLKWDPQHSAAEETGPNKSVRTNAEDIVRIETSLVVCDLLVLDERGNPIDGLRAADFELSEDGRPQQIEVFGRGNNLDFPRTLVLIIDYSPSQFPYLETSIEAAKVLVDKLSPNDRMAIVTDDVELLADFTDDKTLLKQKLDLLFRRTQNYPGALTEIFGRRQPRFGRSAQYSALMATLKEAFSEDLRPIIVFQTDGDEAFALRNPIVVPSIPPNLPEDFLAEEQKRFKLRLKEITENRTEFSIEDVYRAAERSRATIYTVIPGFRYVGFTPEKQLEQAKAEFQQISLAWAATASGRFRSRAKERIEDRLNRTPPEAWRDRATEGLKIQSALAQLAPLSGGATEYLQSPSQAQEVYSRIFLDINRRYVIGYYPSNKTHDGKRRKINVVVRNHPNYQVIGRRSYVAPAPDQ